MRSLLSLCGVRIQVPDLPRHDLKFKDREGDAVVWVVARMPPRRVHRFRGCSAPELEFWHVAVWTKTLRFGCRIGFYSAFREKTKRQGFCSRLSFLSKFTVFRAFSVSVFGLELGWFRLWLSSAFSFLFLFWFPGGGWGGGMGGILTSMAMRLLTFASAVSSSFLLLSWGIKSVKTASKNRSKTPGTSKEQETCLIHERHTQSRRLQVFGQEKLKHKNQNKRHTFRAPFLFIQYL